MILPQHPFGVSTDAISLDELSQRLAQAHGWEAKNRLLIQLAKALPEFATEFRQDEYRVAGCESQVWLLIQASNGKYDIAADSDSKIIKGLLTLILAAYHGSSAEEIQQFDFNAWLNQLGLHRFLSASRGNGLAAIVTKIKQHTISMR
ncbi:SufE family protein [Deefgea sp. CFH1-16]|uniref:SufE family protein n=1 Tax=Deefgea sp. CFH1-16 TaxID=2675457 RepID=UPI0015F68E0E|nr:SufE family protein [Deefgea sp. CFH1-16]MBM5573055.1 Fe-S metabolism protein SufE [Deefgea sp. CFH1-16]